MGNGFYEDCASRIVSRVQVTLTVIALTLMQSKVLSGWIAITRCCKRFTALRWKRDTLLPGSLHRSDMKVVSGNPDPKHISTSYVERQN